MKKAKYIPYKKVRVFHMVMGIFSIGIILATIACLTLLKQECPDNLFYYRTCQEFGSLNIAIFIDCGIFIGIGLFLLFVWGIGIQDKCAGFLIMILNIAAIVVLCLAINETIHYDWVYQSIGLLIAGNYALGIGLGEKTLA